MADRRHRVTGLGTRADGALDRVRGRTARPVTGAVHGATIRGRIRIPLRFADDYSTIATVVSVTGLADAQQHVAFELGRPGEAGLPLVPLHSECLTGDVFGSQRCECRPQLREAVERIANHGELVFCPARVANALAARLDGLAGVEVISSGRNVEVAAMLAPRAASANCSASAAP